MLPFRMGMRVSGEEFCGRRRDLASLREYMRSSGRVYVVGERRIGKTSVVFEASRTIRGTHIVDVVLKGDLSRAPIGESFVRAAA